MKNLKTSLQELDDLKELLVELHKRKSLEEPIPLEQVGEHIKSFRKERNITQNDFAALAGVSKNVLASIEAGRHTVRLEGLLRVTNALALKIVLHE